MRRHHAIGASVTIAALSAALYWQAQRPAEYASPPADDELDAPAYDLTQAQDSLPRRMPLALTEAAREDRGASASAPRSRDSVATQPAISSLKFLVKSTAGEPLEGVAIDVWQDDLQASVRLHTDAEGRARVMGLSEAPTRLSCSNAKHHEAPQPVTVRARGQEIVFEMRPTGIIAGVVVGPDDQPLLGVGIGREMEDGMALLAVTDAHGRFSFEAPLGEPINLQLTGDQLESRANGAYAMTLGTGNSHFRGGLHAVLAPATDLVLRANEVAHDRTLQVLVLAPDGLPARAADVAVWVRSVPTLLEADIEGRATVTGLPDEDVQVSAYPKHKRGAPWVAAKAVHVIPSGQQIELRLRRGEMITGVVLDASGGPLRGEAIEAECADEVIAHAVSDNCGRFRLLVAPDAIYTVSVPTGGDRKPAASVAGVRARDRDVVLRLPRP